MNKDEKEKSEIMPAKSAEDYLEDGDKYRQQKKWLEAIKAYTGAIKLDENDFRSYERRGRCYFEKGDYHEAILDLTRAAEIQPQRYLLYDLRGRANAMLGDKVAMAADFTKAIELHPGHNVYLHKALALSQMGEFEKALVDLNKAIELKADYAYAYLHRGVIYQKLDKMEKAKDDFQRTAELDTNPHWRAQAREHLQEMISNEK